MQISICWLAVCAVMFALPLAVRGIDNEAQSKAREALEMKLKELQSQAPPEPTPPPTVAIPSAKRKTPSAPERHLQAVAPVTVATDPVAQPAPPPALQAVAAAPLADPDAIARAREAVRQKLNELPEAQPPVAPAAPASAPAPAAVSPPVAATPPAVLITPSASVQPPFQPLPAGPATDAESLAKAREAMRQALSQLPPEPAVQPALPGGSVAAAPTSVRPVKVLSFPALAAPPLPISASKQGRLNELSRKYKADELTPEQYHSERAKIIAEP